MLEVAFPVLPLLTSPLLYNRPTIVQERFMDRDAEKRDREEPAEGGAVEVAAAELAKKNGKRGETGESRRMDVTRPPGLFEFPWQKGERLLVPEPPDEWDLRDVFFSSLVDGCSAAIGVPGDRLSPAAPDPFCLPEEPSDWEPDGGAECFWSSVLRQPFSAVYSKSCNA